MVKTRQTPVGSEQSLAGRPRVGPSGLTGVLGAKLLSGSRSKWTGPVTKEILARTATGDCEETLGRGEAVVIWLLNWLSPRGELARST